MNDAARPASCAQSETLSFQATATVQVVCGATYQRPESTLSIITNRYSSVATHVLLYLIDSESHYYWIPVYYIR